MAATLHLQVATPERQLVNEDVQSVQIPGLDGYIGILPDHAPLLGRLGAGVLSYSSGSGTAALAIDGGFLEILDNQVRVLAERAALAREIDPAQARKELSDAQAALQALGPEDDPQAALQKVAGAQARVDVTAAAAH